MADTGTTGFRNGRQLLIVAGAGVVGVALSGLLLWKVLAGPAQADTAIRSPDEARLLERAAREKARATAQARKIRQDDVGQGMRFDAEGNLTEDAPEGSSDLPQNKALDEAASGPPPRDAIAQGIMRRGRPGLRATPAMEDETPEGAGAGDLYSEPPAAGGGRASEGTPERSERPDPNQSMLGYSTVRSARWAARRPDGETTSTEKKTVTERDDDAMGKVVKAMEDSVKLAAAGPPQAGAGAPSAAATPAGLWTGGGPPQVAPGPSGHGAALYAGAEQMPAESAAQMFASGGIGDMRIGGDVGPDYVVRQGKFLDCVLVTRLQADLVDSPVVAMVSRDFVTLDGKYVLVPAGAKLLGAAGSVGNLQQARVYIKFDRVIFPDQRAAHFPVRKVPAVDGEGAVGIEGDVNRHFMLQFGAAVMLGLLDGLAAAVQGPAAAGEPTLRELVAARTSSNLSNVVAGVIQRYANVVPTISVEPGAKMKVFFAEDVRMSPYLTTSELSWVRGRR